MMAERKRSRAGLLALRRARVGGLRRGPAVLWVLPMLLGLWGGVACHGRAWDASALEPRLAPAQARRLQEITPYVWPRAAHVTFFLCRWRTGAPVPVALPAGANAGELRALRAALGGWERAGLGVRFLEVMPGEASIRMELLDDPVLTDGRATTGHAITDCGLRDPGRGAPAALDAELVSSRVRLGRRVATRDGGLRPLTPAELAGAAAHELGHALGFQGHVWGGASVMTVASDALREAGARLLAGEAVRDDALAALYAVPSGTVLARAPVERWRTDLVDRMARLAAANALHGPFVRVGDRTARIYWRDARGMEYGLEVLNLAEVLRRPGRLLVIPEARTRGALPRSRDLRPGR